MHRDRARSIWRYGVELIFSSSRGACRVRRSRAISMHESSMRDRARSSRRFQVKPRSYSRRQPCRVRPGDIQNAWDRHEPLKPSRTGRNGTHARSWTEHVTYRDTIVVHVPSGSLPTPPYIGWEPTTVLYGASEENGPICGRGLLCSTSPG